MRRGWSLSLPEVCCTENSTGENAEKIPPGLRAARLLWLLTWLILFCLGKRGKVQGKASAQGHWDWQGTSLWKQTAMCACLTLFNSPAATFYSILLFDVKILCSLGYPRICFVVQDGPKLVILPASVSWVRDAPQWLAAKRTFKVFIYL